MAVSNIEVAKMMAYDHSYSYSCSLYDNLPYIRTYERCNENTVRMFSGNVIKNMYYNMQEAIHISNRDDEFLAKLNEMRMEAGVVADENYVEIDGNTTDEDAMLDGLMADYVEPDLTEYQEPQGEAPVILSV